MPAAGPAIIQVDICAEELHNSAPAAVALQVSSDWWRAGHVTSVLTSDWPQGDIRATVELWKFEHNLQSATPRPEPDTAAAR